MKDAEQFDELFGTVRIVGNSRAKGGLIPRRSLRRFGVEATMRPSQAFSNTGAAVDVTYSNQPEVSAAGLHIGPPAFAFSGASLICVAV